MSEEEPLKEQIVDAFRDAPDDEATVETVRGLLASEEGVRPAEEDVRDELGMLIEEDRVEEVSSTGEGTRYRLVEAGY